jgi:hypothetical protein
MMRPFRLYTKRVLLSLGRTLPYYKSFLGTVFAAFLGGSPAKSETTESLTGAGTELSGCRLAFNG